MALTITNFNIYQISIRNLIYNNHLQNTLWTPVYTTSDRRNAMGVGLVFEADLATKEHVSHWILQGVCLLLNTD